MCYTINTIRVATYRRYERSIFMYGFPSRDYVNGIKERYPAGTRVKLNYMNDPYAVESGTCGTVRAVDDMGTVFVNWDNGRSLGVCLEEDSISII